MSAHDDPRVPNCKFNPCTGMPMHEGVSVSALRRDPYYSRVGWSHNPWTGDERNAGDLAMDPHIQCYWNMAWGPMLAAKQEPRTSAPLAGVVAGPHLHDTIALGGEADPTGRSAHDAGAKLDAGKTRVWLCVSGFSRALEAVAAVTTKGAEKYAPNSWMEVPQGQERYMEAAARHLIEIGKGNRIDDGPGGTNCLHLAQVAWNVLASLELELRAEEKR